MAGNFPPHMANQMMQQQQRQQQQQHQQQRPPNGGDPREAVANMIAAAIQNQPLQNPQGWQQQVMTNERMGIVQNILGNIRLASSAQPQPPTLHKMIELAIRFERDIFEKSADKATYKNHVEQKLGALKLTREKQQQALQNAIQVQAQQQAQAQAQAAQSQQAQQMMMNQNQLQQAQMRNMAQQPFQHLQHQMQASPIAGQQQQAMGLDMGNGMGANLGVTPQQQFQMQMAAQQALPAQPNMPARQPNQQNIPLSPQENQWAIEYANRMMQTTSEEQKASFRLGLQGRLSATQLQNLAANNIDLAFHWFRQQAIDKIRRSKLASGQGQGQGQNGLAPGAQVPPQRSMNPSPLNGGGQPQPPQMQLPGGGDGFMNMENIAAQQQQGMLAQHTGEVVVPVSAQRNTTPQPGGSVQNAQQQRLLLQQQQQRLQVQQQNQARLAQQQKAQAGLTGQPGGMGSGPMPPQPSPAMPTLNTPMRTPQQMNAPAPDQQVNPGGNFGQQFDPRFARQMNQNMNGLNIPGGNTGMQDLHRQQQIANLSPEKFQELVSKYGEARVQQMLQQNIQGVRPGMSMQGAGGQAGQQMPNQANPQTIALQQYMANNPGRPIPQALTNNLTPQQQNILRQQQMVSGANINAMQQQPGQTPMEQNMIRQMDGQDLPQQVFGHPQMPQNIPRELKKWGQLKLWAQQNQQNLGPGVMDNIRNLQKLHYQNILRSKQQQQNNMAKGAPQMGMPGVPNMGAPVAPMGQNPTQMPGNNTPQNILPPTQEEINALRSHPALIGAPDDRIRAFIANRNAQMNPQQLAQRNQAIIQMQQNAQMQQLRAAQPQQPAATPQMTMSTPQQKPAQVNETNTGGTALARQASRSQAAQKAAQVPSPSQNNLKRASSDDVVEVPNPNQAKQQAPQAHVNQQRQPTGLPVLTPQQIASMKPEQREKYEAMMRARQQGAVHADLMKLKSINEEEIRRPQDPPIPMDAATKASTASRLRSVVPMMTNVTKAIPKWYQIVRDETRARQFFHTKIRIQAQFADPQLSTLKDVFSMTPQDVEQARSVFGTIVKDLSEKFPHMMMKQDSQQNSLVPVPQASSQTSAPSAPQAMPLNAANLQQQQQQLNKMHQRSGSLSSRPPAAPTSAQPPFQLGAPSPQGLPAYIGKNAITQDKLHIPPRKKQKQNLADGGQTTPASNASPQVAKIVSPEVKREQGQFKAQAKPALVCNEPDCDRHNSGFDTQEALDAHTREEHIRPLQDPAKYAQDNLATLLGLDADGNVKSKDLVVKAEQQSIVDNKGKAVDKFVPQAPANVLPHADIAGSWEGATINPNDLFQVFGQFESGAGGAISDMNVYRSIATPNDTPESSNQQSEPTSDISDGVALDISLDIFDDSWQPFGQGIGGFAGEDLAPVDENVLKMFDDIPPNLATWDDLVDSTQLEKPFEFDVSLFSMDG